MGIRGLTLAALLAAAPAHAQYVYVLGGGGSGSVDVYMSQFLGGGSLATWQSCTPLPVLVKETWAATDGAYLYVFYGVGGSGQLSDCYSAPIQGGGTLGAWSSQAAMPQAYYQPCVVFAAGWLYHLGGWVSGPLTDVNSSSASGGVLSGWNTQTALPVGVAEHAACTDGSYAYLCGNYGSGSGTNLVISAPIAGGSVGAWTYQTVLPGISWAGTVVATGGYLYYAGGTPNFGTGVYSAQSIAGNVGGWSSQNPLPVTQYETAMVTDGSYLYITGGYPSTSDCYSAPITGGGSIGGWVSQPAFPVGRGEHSIAAVVAVVSNTPTPSFTPTRTRTPTRTPTSAAATFVPTPTCAIPIGTVVAPYLLVDKNSFTPGEEFLQVVWAVKDSSSVQVGIFDSAGEKVKDLAIESCRSGTLYRAVWDGRNYLDRLVTGNIYVIRLVILGDKQPIERRIAVLR